MNPTKLVPLELDDKNLEAIIVAYMDRKIEWAREQAKKHGYRAYVDIFEKYFIPPDPNKRSVTPNTSFLNTLLKDTVSFNRSQAARQAEESERSERECFRKLRELEDRMRKQRRVTRPSSKSPEPRRRDDSQKERKRSKSPESRRKDDSQKERKRSKSPEPTKRDGLSQDAKRARSVEKDTESSKSSLDTQSDSSSDSSDSSESNSDIELIGPKPPQLETINTKSESQPKKPIIGPARNENEKAPQHEGDPSSGFDDLAARLQKPNKEFDRPVKAAVRGRGLAGKSRMDGYFNDLDEVMDENHPRRIQIERNLLLAYREPKKERSKDRERKEIETEDERRARKERKRKRKLEKKARKERKAKRKEEKKHKKEKSAKSKLHYDSDDTKRTKSKE
eukprot:TRINITY_DN5239_c0_g1_i8.p1 TRINITY_DN5239_c0_g1~~TRINITY_DN5239_c0_g1_i8.p1  ORF type:complete len:393 (+),score=108.97 TRINITY_DN5239_c0_g1_i8:80-1258(+)